MLYSRFRTLGRLLGLACVVTPLTLPLITNQSQADEITYWNGVMLDAIRSHATPPPRSSRGLAMMHTAMYDAVNSVGQHWQPYHQSSRIVLAAPLKVL